MRSDSSAFPTSPVIAAARLRTPRHQRGRARQVENNYIAETPLTVRKKKRNRNGPGAPAGNLNALKHGYHRAGARALRDEIWPIIQRVRLLIRLRDITVKLQKLQP